MLSAKRRGHLRTLWKGSLPALVPMQRCWWSPALKWVMTGNQHKWASICSPSMFTRKTCNNVLFEFYFRYKQYLQDENDQSVRITWKNRNYLYIFYWFTIFLFPNAAKDLRSWKVTTKLGTMAAVSVSKVVWWGWAQLLCDLQPASILGTGGDHCTQGLL